MTPQPVLLMVLDGLGVNPSRAHNAWALARTPHLDHYFASNPHTVLQASGGAVGLPDGQFGDSEVGHLTLGSGRVLETDLVRVGECIRRGDLARLSAWRDLLRAGKRIHLVGLVSDGGVHSHIQHLFALLTALEDSGCSPVIHMISDGRDTPPNAAQRFAETLERRLAEGGAGEIASVSGRFYAMDRAGHWDRTEKAWSAMVLGTGLHADTAREAIISAHARGESDEFVQPTVVGKQRSPVIQPDEAVVFFNFRGDRMRQLAAAVGATEFAHFPRESGSRRAACMTEYDGSLALPVLLPRARPDALLAEVLSGAGLMQFRCAEREKFPHVTYFFNGGRESPFPGEDREVVPSPDVATYDLSPEMSAQRVADRVIEAVRSERYHFTLVNFANGDMVGHTGNQLAAIQAVEALDLQCHRVIREALRHGVRVLLTADHGNCDEMVEPSTGEPHTQHTVYPVPFLLLGAPGERLAIGGGLADVAPTVLDLMGLPQPSQMDGRSLLLGDRVGARE